MDVCLALTLTRMQVVWALARIRHTPSPSLVTRLLDAAEPQLSSFTADNIATLVWGLAEVAPDAPVTLFLVRGVQPMRPCFAAANPASRQLFQLSC
jgi:hypothetical protein